MHCKCNARLVNDRCYANVIRLVPKHYTLETILFESAGCFNTWLRYVCLCRVLVFDCDRRILHTSTQRHERRKGATRTPRLQYALSVILDYIIEVKVNALYVLCGYVCVRGLVGSTRMRFCWGNLRRVDYSEEFKTHLKICDRQTESADSSLKTHCIQRQPSPDSKWLTAPALHSPPSRKRWCLDRLEWRFVLQMPR